MDGYPIPKIPSNFAATNVTPGCWSASANIWSLLTMPATCWLQKLRSQLWYEYNLNLKYNTKPDKKSSAGGIILLQLVLVRHFSHVSLNFAHTVYRNIYTQHTYVITYIELHVLWCKYNSAKIFSKTYFNARSLAHNYADVDVYPHRFDNKSNQILYSRSHALHCFAE